MLSYYEKNPTSIINREICNSGLQTDIIEGRIQPTPIPEKIYLPVDNLTRRLVFDCMPYNKEDHILDLKLRIEDSFVNYHIVTEGAWTHTGLAKELKFNFSNFEYYK